jgi:hypothetical protein
MWRVQAGDWTLPGTTAQVCPSGEDNPDNCGPVLNALSGCGSVATPLDDTLSAMMVNSSNRATNAVQELVGTSYFPPVFPWNLNMAGAGRLAINSFGASIGLTDTLVNHKFGCGGFCDNPVPNSLTLVDAERLYRSIATDTTILSPAMRVELKDLMLNESGSFLDDIIDQEAADTGKNAWREDFRDLFFQIYKAGSWNCSGNSYLSRAGLIQLPTHNGAYKQLYTWGVFAHDTQSEFYIDGTEPDASRELLRLPIRAALLTWGLDYVIATEVGGVADGADELAQSGSPGGPHLADAAAVLRLAADVLQREPRDYTAAFGLLRQAVDHLEAARRLDRQRGPARLVRQLMAIAPRAALDVEAFVTMTTKSTTQSEAIAEMERRMARGRALTGRGAFAAAIREYEAAVARGNPLIDWADRGPVFSNPDQGFFGVPAQPAR